MTYEQSLELRASAQLFCDLAISARRAGRAEEEKAWKDAQQAASEVNDAIDRAIQAGKEHSALMAHVANCRARGSVVSLLE